MSFFDQFERSAWRLETQPFYQPDAEEFDRWQRGLATTGGPRARWITQVAAATAAGRSIGRVLVVALPLTPYWRWRLAIGPEHVAAGEDIRIAIADGGQPGSRMLDRDFWLLDDELVRYIDYDAAGRFLGITDSREQAAVRVARSLRTLAVAGSVPLQEFLLPA